jgi:hypothetical protein
MTQANNVAIESSQINSSGVLQVVGGGTGLSSLTSGYIPYGNGTGSFNSSGNLTFTGSNLNISQFASSAGWQWSGTASSAASIYNGIYGIGTNSLAFATTGSEAMRIASTGYVGIGTSSPNAPLNIGSYSLSNGTINLNGSGTNANFMYIQSTGAGGVLGVESSSGASIVTGSSANATVLYTTGSTPLQFGVNSNIKATIDNAGNLSIGSATAQNVLSVTINNVNGAGFTLLNNNTTGYFSLDQMGTTGFGVSGWANSTVLESVLPSGSSNGLVLSSYTSGTSIIFQTNGRTERARIDSGGNFILGTTSALGLATIWRTTNGVNVQATNTSSTFTNPIQQNTGYATGSNTWYALVCQSGNGSTVTTNNCFIYGNGNIVNINNSYGTLSDAKLKSNITSVGSQWNDVKALGNIMSKFTLNSDPEQKMQLGWIAQDVQKISPGLVFEEQDKDIETYESLGTTTLGVNTSVAMLKAFKALSEALERIERLEKQVAALQAKLG